MTGFWNPCCIIDSCSCYKQARQKNKNGNGVHQMYPIVRSKMGSLSSIMWYVLLNHQSKNQVLEIHTNGSTEFPQQCVTWFFIEVTVSNIYKEKGEKSHCQDTHKHQVPKTWKITTKL
jgi:hypothetical protein